ncbi:MAG: UDP-glucose/GDP-mannose dehydrogenase family protein [Deltaproteobacteria bacterium]|nr:MAG: UDP-glucose/GDP-mannose dehydrogenase family protein [Deltaproteobacteria bacterium]
MHICVVGVGYVGLVTGACFAEFGVNVTCVDKDAAKIDLLKQGEVPFYEPGLTELIRKNFREDRLSFTTDAGNGIRQSLVIFIAVGTPSAPDGSADLQYIREVATTIGHNLDGYKVIVTKSTVPVGTGQMIAQIIEEERKTEISFDVVSNPEFLREGSAIEDFMRPNRVVIGAESDQAIAILKDLYSPLYLIETPFVITDVQTSEMIKYASNAFLATKVSFINEMANICEQVGADVHQVAKGMGLDRRIGPKFLHPGPGFGGSCFPKDIKAIERIGRDHGYSFEIVKAVRRVNKRQRKLMVDKINHALGGVEGKTLAILGLTFKPNTDDMREAPSIDIVRGLQRQGAKIRAFDPAGMGGAKKILKKVHYAEDAYEAARGAHGLVIVTEWNQFRNLNWSRMSELLREPVVIDLRNIYEPKRMRGLGFRYACVGRQGAD